MLLHRRSIVLEVCLVLIVAQAASSADYDYKPTKKDHYSGYSDKQKEPDYIKLFEESQPSASNNDEKKSNYYGFVNPAEFEAFFSSPLQGFGEQSGKESKSPQSFAASPKAEADPFEGFDEDDKEEASEDNPLHKDYFEENKKARKAEEDDVNPGPYYDSHQIPVPDVYGNEERAQSKDDVETIPPPLKGKHKKKKVKASSSAPDYEIFHGYGTYEPLTKSEGQAEQSKLDPLTYYGIKNIDYNTGKSSSSVSQHPAASYVASRKVPTSTLSPYEQYGFEPAASNYEALQSKYFESVATTRSPLKNSESAHLNGEDQDGGTASSNKAESTQNKDCRKIEGPENADGMNCFVCENAVNKAKYTQCSYTSSEQPVNQYAGSSIRYSTPVKAPASFLRNKRSSEKDSYKDDPYYIVSERNRKYFEDYEKDHEAAQSEREKDYNYEPFGPEEYESYSESQSSELLKQPGACTKVDRDGMTCTVCKDPKTGGNFEQCSYTSAPKGQTYAYVAEKKYDSDNDDNPEESKVVTKANEGGEEESEEDPQKGSSSAPVPQSAEAPEEKFSSATKSKIEKDATPELAVAASEISSQIVKSPIPELAVAASATKSQIRPSPDKSIAGSAAKSATGPIPELTAAGTTIDATGGAETEEDDDESSSEEESDDAETKKKEKQAEEDLYGPSYFNYGELKKDKKLVDDDPYDVPEHFAESINKEKASDSDDYNFDEYHYKLFPELNNENAESRTEEQVTEPSEQKQHDVEEVLAEFAKKDRSNCKKAEKNGMTCFLCVDQNKVQHEECMYIAESKPKPTHIAYHEVQRLKDPKGEHQPFALDESENEEESKKVETIASTPQSVADLLQPQASETSKRKKFFKKVITNPQALSNVELTAAASGIQESVVVPFEKEKKKYVKQTIKDSRASGSAPDSERLQEEEGAKKQDAEEPEAPKEIDVDDEEGAYSHETKPVFSKLYGTTLPRYMVEKTEFEKDFDAASGFA
ncbi:hypothetical protein HUJ04_003414 [Dendroctonus ponderosae]|nr:hypothetical protein HUJ04_003414 [Dendroctonus ponderosae]